MSQFRPFPVLERAQVRACPLCQSDGFSVLKTNDRYDMGLVTVGCTACGLIQTNPRPTSDALADFYARDYRTCYQNVTSPSEEYIRGHYKDQRMKYTVDFILSATEGRGAERVLDVGCSEGAFFQALRAGGYTGTLVGVEPNPAFASYAATRTGARVVGTLEQAGVGYDLVTLSHVFEHMLQPDVFLEQIKLHLGAEGLLYIDVPDADRYSTLGDLHIAHVYHFTSRTLKALLEAHGFEVLQCEQHDPPHHPKSVRAVAKIAVDRAVPGSSTSRDTEQAAWRAVARLPVRRYFARRAIGATRWGSYLSRTWKHLRGARGA